MTTPTQEEKVGDVKDPVAELFRCVDWQDNLDVEQALRELERRARVERRLEKWLREEGELRARTQSNVSAKLKDYRRDREWFAVREGELKHADDWTLLDAALDAAGAPKESE